MGFGVLFLRFFGALGSSKVTPQTSLAGQSLLWKYKRNLKKNLKKNPKIKKSSFPLGSVWGLGFFFGVDNVLKGENTKKRGKTGRGEKVVGIKKGNFGMHLEGSEGFGMGEKLEGLELLFRIND